MVRDPQSLLESSDHLVVTQAPDSESRLAIERSSIAVTDVVMRRAV
jgi:hypothetical protein